jgi:hypothetical protein
VNTERLAQALNTIAMGFAEAAEAISTGAPVSAPRPAAGAVSPPAPAGTFSDGTPVDEPERWEEFAASSPSRASVDVLAECPVHFRPWEVKEGGISKAGKPYSAFWKCNGKNADGSFCSKKPTKEWAQAHPAEREVAA